MHQTRGQRSGSVQHSDNEVVIYHQSTPVSANSLSKKQCHVLH